MLIIPQIIKVKWSPNNKKHFMSKGYKFTKMKDEFFINVEDLSLSSNVKIDVQCDYCKNIYQISYNNYNRVIARSYTKKYACSKCYSIKIKETNLKKYNVENINQLIETREKSKQTNLKKYGVDNPAKSNIIKEKTKQTNLNKFGYTCSLNNPIIREKAIIKTLNTMYNNNTGACSRQQRYLQCLLNGKLNYPVDKCMLDIAFPNEMIYIEYDGSGHDLSVRLGMSKDDFKIKELKRKQFLQNKGWKLIRIISKNDLLPQDQQILSIIKECKDYLNENHSWIEINIDEKYILNSKDKKNILLDNLRKIREDDLNGFKNFK